MNLLKNRLVLALLSSVFLAGIFSTGALAASSPTVLLSPPSGLPNDVLTAYGDNWVKGTSIEIWFDANIVQTFIASDTTWQHVFTVPGSATVGLHHFVFSEKVGSGLLYAAPFTVRQMPTQGEGSANQPPAGYAHFVDLLKGCMLSFKSVSSTGNWVTFTDLMQQGKYKEALISLVPHIGDVQTVNTCRKLACFGGGVGMVKGDMDICKDEESILMGH